MTTWVVGSRTCRLFVAAGALGVFAITGAPSAAANPVAVCTSHVVDGVEVDDCVGNPNADSGTDVPDVRVRLDLRIGFGI
jgi:hypothetical protein